MNNKIIKALEECRKSLLRGNKITTLIFGDTETGKSWNEMNDIKGRISITRRIKRKKSFIFRYFK